MKRYCLALDLQEDPALIAEYEDWHTRVSPEIKKSITDAGITRFDIYRVGYRMFAIIPLPVLEPLTLPSANISSDWALEIKATETKNTVLNNLIIV